MKATVEYGQVRDLQGRFQRLPPGIEADAGAAVRRATEIIYDQAKANIARLFRSSGKMENALKIAFDRVGAGVRGTVSIEGVGYVTQELGGRRAYDIFPVNRKALAFSVPMFLGAKTMERAFAARVHREPLPARSFLRAAYEQKRDEVAVMFGGALKLDLR